MSNEAEAVAGEAPKKMDGLTKFLLMFFIGLPVLMFVGCSVLLVAGGDGSTRPPSNIPARNQCQDWVRDKLKAPATAEFTGTVGAPTSTGWSFTGQVDAENSFGGQVRAEWSCVIRSDGNLWRGSAVLN